MKHSALIDITKVVASQVIVLHHLILYAPMSEWLARAWPGLVAAMADHGRLAVQPFLVIGGFLAARSVLSRGAGPLVAPLWQRYRRLAPPLAVALLLVVLSSWHVGQHLNHLDWFSPPPSPTTLMVHMLLLQDVLGVPSISAGAWYVAIDLQLFALALLLARLSMRSGTGPRLPVLLAFVSTMAVLSLLVFSRKPDLDMWAIYFFGAYGLGMLAGLSQYHPAARPWLALVLCLTMLDVLWEPRARPLVAAVVTTVLLSLAARPWPRSWPRLAGVLRYFSEISYSVFVCHFAVIILVSGWWERLDTSGFAPAAGWILLAWAGSLLVGAAVHALVDRLTVRVGPTHKRSTAPGQS